MPHSMPVCSLKLSEQGMTPLAPTLPSKEKRRIDSLIRSMASSLPMWPMLAPPMVQ